MSWFSSAFSAVGDLFSNSEVVAPLIQGAASLGGAVIASNANDKAAETVAAAERERAEAIRASSAEAGRRYDEQAELTKESTEYLRRLAGNDPYQLTPAQQQGLEDAQRDANATLAASGLRGAGRAVTAALKGVDKSYRSGAIESNIDRRQSAASQLSGQGFAATGSSIDTGLRGATGAADATARGATAGADASLANAGMRGAALGDVGALIADDIKTRGRESKYDKTRYASGDQP